MAIQSRKVFIHTKADFGWMSSEVEVRSLSQLATVITIAVHDRHVRELSVPVGSVEERISAVLFDTGFTRGLFDVCFGELQVSVKLSYMDGESVSDWYFSTTQDANAIFFKH